MPSGYPGSSPVQVCEYCEKKFQFAVSRRFCSKRCCDLAKVGRHRVPVPHCVDCGKEIDTSSARLRVNPQRRCRACHFARFSGKTRHGEGYIIVRTGVNQRELEHRLVMEKKIGRPLKSGEVVHHISGVRTDNRPENLELCESAGQHVAQHHRNAIGRKPQK